MGASLEKKATQTRKKSACAAKKANTDLNLYRQIFL